MNLFFLLADAKDDFNQYLENNPAILGLGSMALGLLIGGWGVVELISGVSRDKKGRVLEGTSGKAASLIRVVAGLGLIGFGLFKLVAG